MPVLDKLRAEGVALLNQGKPAPAAARFQAALAEAPEDPELHNSLGAALAAQGRHDDAVGHFARAVELRPDFADAWHNWGNSLRRREKDGEAVERYLEAVKIRPNWPDALNNLALAYRGMERLDEAEAQLRLALRCQPQHAEARNNLGVLLADRGKWPEAAAAYRQALRLRPNAPETHNNLGVVLVRQNRIAEAIERYQTALRLKPDYADANNNLGNALRQEGRLDEAEQNLRRALELRPDYAEASNNLAIVLVKKGALQEAIVYYQQALRLKCDYPDAHKNLALGWLAAGDFAQGWPEYEWRWRTKETPARPFTQPRWGGEPLPGQTVLLYYEQGLGDTLQFIRYLPLVQERCGHVVVECQRSLVPLLTLCLPGIRLVAQGDELPEFAAQIPLLSLPTVFQTTLETIPNKVPYLTGAPDLVKGWKQGLDGTGKFRVGIAWQGNPKYAEDRHRSIPLHHFGKLAKVPGVRLISLQKGPGAEQLAGQGERWNILDLGKRLDEEGGAFMDTAAVMKNLDLVITSDSAVAHLAGGLGVPVWLVLPRAADWRWLQDRDDSPWYPTMRLFRQNKWGNWDEVFDRLARELHQQPALESAAYHAQTANRLLKAGQPAEAAEAFRSALRLAPNESDLHNDLGVALERQGKQEEAVASFEKAIQLKADNTNALHNLGNVLRRLDRLPAAESRYRQALRLDPNSADLCNHLGIALLWQGKHGEAEACFRRALRLKRDHAEALNNLGVVLEQLGRLDEAVAAYQDSLRAKPDAPDTHKNLALVWLMSGDYALGWPEYEWRWKLGGRARNFNQPRWDGKPLQGQTVLLWPEQGLGDTIQFIRYAPLVRQRGATVVVECPGELKPLLSRCPGIDQLLTSGSPHPEFAFHAPLVSLPAIFHDTAETVPANVPYLSAEPERIAYWRQQLEGAGAIKIGIAWQGSTRYQGDRHRSIPLVHFAPLAGVPGVRLVSLQKGFGTEQLVLAEEFNILDLGNRLDQDGAFLDTAAVMKNLDLVITSDTAVAHLAGALAVPVWMATCQAADWRWQRTREDCPWYPTMRLFRQRRWGEWGDVFERMAAELRQGKRPRLPLLTEISPGELLDKLTILEIKRERIREGPKLQNVHIELGSLLAARTRALPRSTELDRLEAQLKRVNERLWEIEDEIRLHEKQQDFGSRFVELARSIYKNNDERARLKKAINALIGSVLVEEKSYAEWGESQPGGTESKP
jgi:Flp pilus assembly protein TadD